MGSIPIARSILLMDNDQRKYERWVDGQSIIDGDAATNVPAFYYRERLMP